MKILKEVDNRMKLKFIKNNTPQLTEFEKPENNFTSWIFSVRYFSHRRW